MIPRRACKRIVGMNIIICYTKSILFVPGPARQLHKFNFSFVIHSRKCKQDAYSAMRIWSPGTPAPGICSEDPPWTPGQWREEESDLSFDESAPDPLKVYNVAMSQIASLSDMKTVEQLTFRLASDWESATANEKALCEERVDEACQAVCKVIAPNASEELLNAYKTSSTLRLDKGENALTAAYRQAPTKNIKTQILSIYALQHSFSELKEMHAHFENLSDRQIKKARAHAKTVGAGMVLESSFPQNPHRFDEAESFPFICRPAIFLPGCFLRNSQFKTRFRGEVNHAQRCENRR